MKNKLFSRDTRKVRRVKKSEAPRRKVIKGVLVSFPRAYRRSSALNKTRLPGERYEKWSPLKEEKIEGSTCATRHPSGLFSVACARVISAWSAAFFLKRVVAFEKLQLARTGEREKLDVFWMKRRVRVGFLRETCYRRMIISVYSFCMYY